jgi:hypothetical protein
MQELGFIMNIFEQKYIDNPCLKTRSLYFYSTGKKVSFSLMVRASLLQNKDKVLDNIKSHNVLYNRIKNNG